MRARSSTRWLSPFLAALVFAPLPLVSSGCASRSSQTATPARTTAPRTAVVERGLPAEDYALLRDHVLPARNERGPELGGQAPVAPRPEEEAAARPWQDRCPKDGLILAVVVRTLPEKLDKGSRVSSMCLFDRVWCTREEARALVPAEPRVGQVYPLPAGFTERLARLHVVDREGGAGDAFAAEDVAASKLAAEVLSVHDTVVRLSVTGELVADDGARRMSTQVRGSAAWDTELATFTSFELVADARSEPAEGASRRVGFVFLLSRAPRPEILPPRLIDAYEPYTAPLEAGGS